MSLAPFELARDAREIRRVVPSAVHQRAPRSVANKFVPSTGTAGTRSLQNAHSNERNDGGGDSDRAPRLRQQSTRHRRYETDANDNPALPHQWTPTPAEGPRTEPQLPSDER